MDGGNRARNFRAGSSREISDKAPPVPVEARGLAGLRVVVQPWAGDRMAFGNSRYRAGSGRSVTGAFGRVIDQGKGTGRITVFSCAPEGTLLQNSGMLRVSSHHPEEP